MLYLCLRLLHSPVYLLEATVSNIPFNVRLNHHIVFVRRYFYELLLGRLAVSGQLQRKSSVTTRDSPQMSGGARMKVVTV